MPRARPARLRQRGARLGERVGRLKQAIAMLRDRRPPRRLHETEKPLRIKRGVQYFTVFSRLSR